MWRQNANAAELKAAFGAECTSTVRTLHRGTLNVMDDTPVGGCVAPVFDVRDIGLRSNNNKRPDWRGRPELIVDGPTPGENNTHNIDKMAIARGLDKTTARVNKKRVSRTKGHLSRRTAHVRDVVREVMGLAPYEKRVIELLRNSKDKRARKLAKKRLGSFQRGKKKVDELQRVIAESRRAGH
ncbi:ribosomal protein L36e-domain-containing protein [Xylaria arbuscula]|nr:ribosomal protein L36e-domain-containing protein [Xylaria arbuscula]